MWSDLSLRQRAQLIQMGVRAGIGDAVLIRKLYDQQSLNNRFDDGGNKKPYRYFTKKDERGNEYRIPLEEAFLDMINYYHPFSPPGTDAYTNEEWNNLEQQNNKKIKNEFNKLRAYINAAAPDLDDQQQLAALIGLYENPLNLLPFIKSLQQGNPDYRYILASTGPENARRKQWWNRPDSRFDVDTDAGFRSYGEGMNLYMPEVEIVAPKLQKPELPLPEVELEPYKRVRGVAPIMPAPKHEEEKKARPTVRRRTGLPIGFDPEALLTNYGELDNHHYKTFFSSLAPEKVIPLNQLIELDNARNTAFLQRMYDIAHPEYVNEDFYVNPMATSAAYGGNLFSTGSSLTDPPGGWKALYPGINWNTDLNSIEKDDQYSMNDIGEVLYPRFKDWSNGHDWNEVAPAYMQDNINDTATFGDIYDRMSLAYLQHNVDARMADRKNHPERYRQDSWFLNHARGDLGLTSLGELGDYAGGIATSIRDFIPYSFNKGVEYVIGKPFNWLLEQTFKHPPIPTTSTSSFLNTYRLSDLEAKLAAEGFSKNVLSWTTLSGIAGHIFPGFIEDVRGSEWGNAVLNALDLYATPKIYNGAAKGLGYAQNKFNNPSKVSYMNYELELKPFTLGTEHLSPDYPANAPLPGLLVPSLLSNSKLAQQVSKKGTINTNNIRTFINKHGSQYEKDLINKVLEDKFKDLKDINYNEFRLAVQEEIPQYNHINDVRYKDFGIERLYPDLVIDPRMRNIELDKAAFNDFLKTHYPDLIYENKRIINKKTGEIIDNTVTPDNPDPFVYTTDHQKIVNEFYNYLGNGPILDTFTFTSDKIPVGNAKHYNYNTLGHSRTGYFENEPDVKYVYESQSDWGQSKPEYDFNINERRYGNSSFVFDPKRKTLVKVKPGEGMDWKTFNGPAPGMGGKTFYQMAQEMSIQPQDIATVNHMVKTWSDRQLYENMLHAALEGKTKMRYPTAETAAKIEGYSPLNNSNVYAEAHLTILNKYSKFPELFKKLYKNLEVRIVTDRAGNTWYEVDIPDTFFKQEQKFSYGGNLFAYGGEDDLLSWILNRTNSTYDPRTGYTVQFAPTTEDRDYQAMGLPNIPVYGQSPNPKAKYINQLADQISRQPGVGNNNDYFRMVNIITDVMKDPNNIGANGELNQYGWAQVALQQIAGSGSHLDLSKKETAGLIFNTGLQLAMLPSIVGGFVAAPAATATGLAGMTVGSLAGAYVGSKFDDPYSGKHYGEEIGGLLGGIAGGGIGLYGKAARGIANGVDYVRGRMGNQEAATRYIGRNMLYDPLEGTMPGITIEPTVRTKVGDIEIDNPNLAYRQGNDIGRTYVKYKNVDNSAALFLVENNLNLALKKEAYLNRESLFDDAINKGVYDSSVGLTDTYDNSFAFANTPMYSRGGLWYGVPELGTNLPNGSLQSGLLVSPIDNNFVIGNNKALPFKKTGTGIVRSPYRTTVTDNSGRLIPSDADNLGYNLNNIDAYTWDPTYGYRRVQNTPRQFKLSTEEINASSKTPNISGADADIDMSISNNINNRTVPTLKEIEDFSKSFDQPLVKNPSIKANPFNFNVEYPSTVKFEYEGRPVLLNNIYGMLHYMPEHLQAKALKYIETGDFSLIKDDPTLTLAEKRQIADLGRVNSVIESNLPYHHYNLKEGFAQPEVLYTLRELPEIDKQATIEEGDGFLMHEDFKNMSPRRNIIAHDEGYQTLIHEGDHIILSLIKRPQAMVDNLNEALPHSTIDDFGKIPGNRLRSSGSAALNIEKGATITLARARALSDLRSKLRRTPTLEEYYNYIDDLSEDQLINYLDQVNSGYSHEYVQNIRNAVNKGKYNFNALREAYKYSFKYGGNLYPYGGSYIGDPRSPLNTIYRTINTPKFTDELTHRILVNNRILKAITRARKPEDIEKKSFYDPDDWMNDEGKIRNYALVDSEPVIIGQAPAQLNTYYPGIGNKYPFTGHSQLFIPVSRGLLRAYEQPETNLNEQAYVEVNKTMASPSYNLLTNNCADATNRYLGYPERSGLLEPWTLKSAVERLHNGKTEEQDIYDKKVGRDRTLIPMTREDEYRAMDLWNKDNDPETSDVVYLRTDMKNLDYDIRGNVHRVPHQGGIDDKNLRFGEGNYKYMPTSYFLDIPENWMMGKDGQMFKRYMTEKNSYLK